MICPITQPLYAVYFDHKYGLVFGKGDLTIDLDTPKKC
jgi:hypothetical protein